MNSGIGDDDDENDDENDDDDVRGEENQVCARDRLASV